MENWWIDLNMTAIRQSEINTRVTNNRMTARAVRRKRPGRPRGGASQTNSPVANRTAGSARRP